MFSVVRRTEEEGLPAQTDGLVVARNESGGRVIWCSSRAYVRTAAPPRAIGDNEWNIAIDRAATIARATRSPLIVIKG